MARNSEPQQIIERGDGTLQCTSPAPEIKRVANPRRMSINNYVSDV